LDWADYFQEGALIVQDDVTITGPVVLFTMACFWKNAIVDGSVYLFAGGLTPSNREPVFATMRFLFAGGLTLGARSQYSDNAVLFAGASDA